MDIEFDDGNSGFWEARLVHALALQAAREAARDGDAALLAFLKEVSLAHLNRPEYASLLADAGVRDTHWPTFSLFSQSWRRSLGPSQTEEDLSAQRSAALERADRAESSAFDAMAEAAGMERERDHWQSEAARLRAEMQVLQEQLARAPRGGPTED